MANHTSDQSRIPTQPRGVGGGQLASWAPACHVVIVFGLIGVMGCASPMIHVEGDPPRYRHRKLGYSVPAPGAGVTSMHWSRVEVPDTDLAFESDRGSLVGLASDCGHPEARVSSLARQLVFGIRDRGRIETSQVTGGGFSGVSQHFVLDEGGRPIAVKTVTLMADGCAIDWFLVAKTSLGESEAIFDAWWMSFDPGPLRMKTSGDEDVEPLGSGG